MKWNIFIAKRKVWKHATAGASFRYPARTKWLTKIILIIYLSKNGIFDLHCHICKSFWFIRMFNDWEKSWGTIFAPPPKHHRLPESELDFLILKFHQPNWQFLHRTSAVFPSIYLLWNVKKSQLCEVVCMQRTTVLRFGGGHMIRLSSTNKIDCSLFLRIMIHVVQYGAGETKQQWWEKLCKKCC